MTSTFYLSGICSSFSIDVIITFYIVHNSPSYCHENNTLLCFYMFNNDVIRLKF